GPTAGGPRAGVEASAEHGHTLADPGEAAAAAVSVAVRGAVVGHLDLELVVAIAQDDSRGGWARVLERIRQRLLDDPECGQLQGGRKHPAFALDLESHVETR